MTAIGNSPFPTAVLNDARFFSGGEIVSLGQGFAFQQLTIIN